MYCTAQDLNLLGREQLFRFRQSLLSIIPHGIATVQRMAWDILRGQMEPIFKLDASALRSSSLSFIPETLQDYARVFRSCMLPKVMVEVCR